jgi:hypothetical protein
LTTLEILIVPAEVVGALRKSHAKNNQFQKPSNNLWVNHNTTTPLNSENLIYYPEIRSTKSEIRNNIKCSKSKFSKQKRLSAAAD